MFIYDVNKEFEEFCSTKGLKKSILKLLKFTFALVYNMLFAIAILSASVALGIRLYISNFGG